jgi:hypothetical protein
MGQDGWLGKMYCDGYGKTNGGTMERHSGVDERRGVSDTGGAEGAEGAEGGENGSGSGK